VPLTVTPPSVPIGGTYHVTAPGGGPLPAKIDCEVSGPAGPLQRNVPLHVLQKFGSMRVQGCDAVNCKETFTYRTTTSNTRPVQMQGNLLDFTFNNQTASLLTELRPNPVAVAGPASVTAIIEVDVCNDQRNCARSSSGVSAAYPPPPGPQLKKSCRGLLPVPRVPSATDWPFARTTTPHSISDRGACARHTPFVRDRNHDEVYHSGSGTKRRS
jgi:hypothetical protein